MLRLAQNRIAKALKISDAFIKGSLKSKIMLETNMTFVMIVSLGALIIFDRIRISMLVNDPVHNIISVTQAIVVLLAIIFAYSSTREVKNWLRMYENVRRVLFSTKSAA